LDYELQGYLNDADYTLPEVEEDAENPKVLKALIGPHAGFTYSGPSAAWAYKNVDPTLYDRVVLLGPSHRLPMKEIGVTTCE
jgi:AmmeMemoRadiSam system protein B